jgi:hypothetical protein
VSDRYKELWEDAFHDSLEMKAEISELKAENARLKAEVERLTAIVGADAIDREHGMCCDASAQVERLTKAGDAMADECSNFQGAWPLIKDWNAAKGVQS